MARHHPLLLLVLALVSESAWTETGAERLLNSPTRPTIQEIKLALAPWPRSNPFGGPYPDSKPVTQFKKVLPRYVAEFEYLFPDLVYAPMGRDVVMLGDMLDAFYQAHGQHGRVARISASGDSIKGDGVTPETLVRLLEASGLDLEPNRLGSNRPFVLIDLTYYGNYSQVGLLMRAAYSEFNRRGGDIRELIRKLNFVNLFNGVSFDDGWKNPDEFFSRIAQEVQSVGFPPRALVSRYPIAAHSDGTVGYTLEWHSTFGPLATQSDGSVRASVPPANSLEIRTQILWELFEIIKQADDLDLLERARSKARKLGVDLDERLASGCRGSLASAK